jgi:ADP-heptose:LPS heptosyltransferase
MLRPPAPVPPGNARRRGPALLLALAWPALKAAAFLLGRGRRPGPPGTLLVFQAYQVGDLYMALPALQLLARHARVTVACRPGCEGILERRGLDALPFPHPLFASAGPSAFLRGLRAAYALRGRTRAFASAFDPSADPRTALMLKAAGCARTEAPRRPLAWLFDAAWPVPEHGPHQAERDWAAAAAWLASRGIAAPPAPPAIAPAAPVAAGAPLLLSCWTRKDEKNWPWERWEEVLALLIALGRDFAVLDAPDGDAGFAAFRARWQGRVRFLSADLPGIEDAARACAGVIGTDNFLGHMAAGLGKPVLWINGSSDPAAVAPRGPRTEIIQADPMPCRPCGNRCVNPDYKACLKGLAPLPVTDRLRSGWPFGPRASSGTAV